MKSPENVVNTQSVAIYSPCESKCAECLKIRQVNSCSKQHNAEQCRTDIRFYLVTQFEFSSAQLTGIQEVMVRFKNPRVSEFGPLIQFFKVDIVADSNIIKRCDIDMECFLARNTKSGDPNRCHTYLLSILFEEMDKLLSAFGFTKISSCKVTEIDYDFYYRHK